MLQVEAVLALSLLVSRGVIEGMSGHTDEDCGHKRVWHGIGNNAVVTVL
jgi:hypothetical protein